MAVVKTRTVAVIGAGIAGATCARELARAGHLVQVFDKSRGPGGRLATRRIEWVDRDGLVCTTRLDHGAVGITPRSPAFRDFVDEAVHAGLLAEWSPVLADGGLPLEDGPPLFVPVPDMPALCRHLLEGVAATWSCAVDRLHPGPMGWQVEAAGVRHAASFDAVVLALPPAQAAPLLGPHRPDWARHAALAPMQPCWTLMGVELVASHGAGSAPGWDLCRPSTGPLAWVLRNDTRPGRAPVPGQAHWVAHARSGWSRRQLDETPAGVQEQLQAALADTLGRPIDWLHGAVHRWRYALPQAQPAEPAQACWWDAAQRLGVCGDFLGGAGVEGAWSSARSLSVALLHDSRRLVA